MITLFSSVKKILITVVFLGVFINVEAQQSLLESYIKEAYERNIVLQQKNISLEKAKIALAIAKGYYYPNVGFQFGYQTAQGGREIQLPIGDMLNGVYSTLNALTNSNNFPQIENQTINFLPQNFYDTKIRTTAPVFNAEIAYNKKISQQQIAIPEYEIEIYKKDLAKDIKVAYYNYLTALQGVGIYKQALELANEGKRVNQSLLTNGKGLPAYLLRSDAEVESLNAELNRANQQVKNAQVYFNFLLNRNFESTIDTSFEVAKEMMDVNGLITHQANAELREEIQALKQVNLISQTVIDLKKSGYYPKLNAFLDLGSQSENFKFNNRSRYYMVGLQLDVPIFSGFRTQNGIKQAQLDLADNKLRIQQSTNQINMSIQIAKNNLKAQLDVLRAKEKQLESSATYLRLIERGYKEGSNTFIETIDARNQFTQAQLSHKIQQYQVFSHAAELERSLSEDPIQK